MSREPQTILLSEEERRVFEKKWNDSFAIKFFGVKIELKDDRVRAIIDPLLPQHRGGMATEAVNGVVLSGLLDLVIGIVGVFHSGDRKSGTAQLSIQFLRPVLGTKVIAEARLLRAGSGMVFAHAEILDDKGQVCGRCDGICGISKQASTYPSLK